MASRNEYPTLSSSSETNSKAAEYSGAKSHWAVIIGLTHQCAHEPTVRWLRSGEDGEEATPGPQLICVQPKSRRVAAWDGEALRASNGNLRECIERRQEDKVVPASLEETLARRVIIVGQ